MELEGWEIRRIRDLFKNDKYELTLHAIRRMDKRGIKLEDISAIIMEGKIIKSYPEDKPYPSHLIQGYVQNEPLYVLCALGEETVYIITSHWFK